MKRILLTIALWLLAADGYAQWTTIFPSEQGSKRFTYADIVCSDSLNCTTVGFYYDPSGSDFNTNFIDRTTDGGESWHRQASPLRGFVETLKGPSLKTAYALDSLNIMAVGDSGTIVRTTDGGSTWKLQRQGLRGTYTAVDMLDSTHALVGGFGGQFSYTTDAGMTWNDTTCSLSHVRSVKMLSRSVWHMYASRATLYRTSDQGRNWDSSSIASDYQGSGLGMKFFESVRYLPNGKIVLVGGNVVEDRPCPLVLTSLDNGTTWDTILNERTRITREINEIEVLNDSTFFIGGGGRWLGFTRDAGRSWHYDTVNDATDWDQINRIELVSPSKIFATTHVGFSSHLIARAELPRASVLGVGARAGTFLFVYPNPTTSRSQLFHNLNSADVTGELIDVLGRTWAKFTMLANTDRTELDIGVIPKGIYIMVTPDHAIMIRKD